MPVVAAALTPVPSVMPGTETAVPVVLLKALTYRMTLASIPSTWDALVPLITSGRLHPEEVFTHRFDLGNAPDAYRLFESREDGVIKVLLDTTR